MALSVKRSKPVKADRLPLRQKISYGIGQAAAGLHGYAIGVFLLFYYNQVLGLSAGLAGLAIGLATVVDAFTDPLVGSISDRWRSPLGRRHPFLYVSVLPVARAWLPIRREDADQDDARSLRPEGVLGARPF
jgi:GPH family glycoside/pentoside/hexuronide:cation symporter